MLAIFMAIGSAMPNDAVSNTNGSTIVAQDTGGDGSHIPPTPPPPPIIP
jgi:hypothetical protein